MKSKGQDLYEALIDQTYNRWMVDPSDPSEASNCVTIKAPKWDDLPDNRKGELESAALEYERRRTQQGGAR